MTIDPKASVQGRLVEEWWGEDSQPGDFKFAIGYKQEQGARPAYLLYCCPCGCGSKGALQLRPAIDEGRPSWEWNDNKEKPTLTPSILHWNTDEKGNRTTEHWHGFLENGYFRSC